MSKATLQEGSDDPRRSSPTIEGKLFPPSGHQGSTLENVLIFGDGFLLAPDGTPPVVSFLGNKIEVDEVTFLDGGRLSIKIRIREQAPTGDRDVKVTNFDNGSGTGKKAFKVT
jgi:hypothetical protein